MKQNTSSDWVDEVTDSLPPLCTVGEAMTLLRCTRRNVYRLIDTGRLRTVRPVESGSSRHLIPRSELARYLRSLDVAA